MLKINDFINSCNEMIEGKFILADVKIKNILNKIEASEELVKFLTASLENFQFDIELQRAEVKNKFNGGVFNVPQNKQTLIALVFCLLIAFDSKKIDFYQFIKQNFETLAPNGEYANFANTLLVPFRDYISYVFSSENFQAEELDENHIENESLNNDNKLEQEIEEKEETIFDKIEDSTNAIIDAVYIDRKIKENLRQQLLYVLNGIKYALKYEDMRLISTFVTCLDALTQKTRSVEFLLTELKTLIKNYYEQIEY